MLSAEWRTAAGGDTILIVEEDVVQQAIAASAELLSRFLTVPGSLSAWRGNETVDSQRADPASWGTLVIARAASGEVIKMDPELYWNGIYNWFRFAVLTTTASNNTPESTLLQSIDDRELERSRDIEAALRRYGR